MKPTRPMHLSLLCLALLSLTATAQPLKLYVAPDGKDNWSGKTPQAGNDGPLATLARARDTVRELKAKEMIPADGIIIEILPGNYVLDSTVEFTGADSGSSQSPIVYSGSLDGKSRLIAGQAVPPLTPLTDPAIRARLSEDARNHVLQTDLSALGIQDFGSPDPAAPGCEIFVDSTPMTLARWPNTGFTHVRDVTPEETKVSHGRKGSKVGKFYCEDDRVERWVEESDGWVNGFWFWDWAEQAHRIAQIDPETDLLTVAKPYHAYGYRAKQWFYGFNLLCELDSPGEYYIDRKAGKLYLWPPEKSRPDAPVYISTLTNAISLTDTSYVTLRNLTIEASRGTLVTIKGGTGNRVEACVLRNSGNRAVTVNGGNSHTVFGCDISETGNGSVTLSGGDRNALTPAGHVLENCWIRRYGRLKRTFCTSVSLEGVGQIARRNLIHDAPYIAIWFNGNDHIIELNEIHSVCLEANDSGAIYAGRAWDMRGTRVRHNYVHDVIGFKGHGCNGIYLDDMFSGTDVTGNIIVRVPRALLIGGGRDNVLTDNTMVDCRYGMHIDSRALGWAKASVNGTMTTRLKAVPYESELWRQRYPKLAGTLADDPGSPKGNTVARNIAVNTQFDKMSKEAKKFGNIGENMTEGDPRFRDAANDDYRLQSGSPAFAMGFKPAPIDQIGIYTHPLRASWPVAHSVRLPEGVTEKYAPDKAPERVAAKGPKTVAPIPRRTTTINVDGTISEKEWSVTGEPAPLPVAQKLNRSKATFGGKAWVRWDPDALYVAFDSTVDPENPLKREAVWGGNDAVEIAVRSPQIDSKTPILVLRGYPCGTFESSAEAGAPKAMVEQAGEGVQFAAGVTGTDGWVGEWRIPFTSLQITPSTGLQIEANLTVRKTGSAEWVQWVGSIDLATWDVRNGGILKLISE